MRKLVLDTLRARFLKLSLVDQVAGHLELAIELVGIVNKARNLGVVILFGSATSRQSSFTAISPCYF